MACDEAQLGPDEYAERMRRQELLQEQVKCSTLDELYWLPVDISEAKCYRVSATWDAKAYA